MSTSVCMLARAEDEELRLFRKKREFQSLTSKHTPPNPFTQHTQVALYCTSWTYTEKLTLSADYGVHDAAQAALQSLHFLGGYKIGRE